LFMARATGKCRASEGAAGLCAARRVRRRAWRSSKCSRAVAARGRRPPGGRPAPCALTSSAALPRRRRPSTPHTRRLGV
jgi:hypothetical protein